MGSLMGNKNLQRNSFVVLSIIFLLFSHNSAHAQDIIDCSPVATNTAASPIIKKTAGSTARSGSTLKKNRSTQAYYAKNKTNKRARASSQRNRSANPVTPPLLSVGAPKGLFPATVIAVKGQAWRGNTQPLTVGTQLSINDVIQTHANSFVSIRLGDGTTSTLPSNSKIELGINRNNVARFKLLNGRVENHVPKVSNPKQNTFEIQLPRAVLGVRGTHFMAELNSNSTQQVQVIEGIVAVQALGQCREATVLHAGEGAVISGDHAQTVAPLLEAPRWIKAKPLQDTERMTFILEPVAGAESYTAQIASDPEFLNIQSETFSDCPRCAKIRMGHVASQIPNGQYYVRFMALDKNNVTGKATQYSFIRQRPE